MKWFAHVTNWKNFLKKHEKSVMQIISGNTEINNDRVEKLTESINKCCFV